MEKNILSEYFKTYISSNSIFKNKKSLQASYIPDAIIHREDEMKQLSSMLAPVLRNDLPSNIFVYGKTGTGKTLVLKKIKKELENITEENNIPLRIFYVNCKLRKITDTEYRLIAELCKMIGEDVPKTGLATNEIYSVFQKKLDHKETTLVLILDEIDELVMKIGDDVLYSLTRINSELDKSQICIVGISNDMTFANELEPRVKSSLNEEDVTFSPYNAMQLQHILSERSKLAFNEGSIDDGVIEKCAAYAARDHGDARRALDLLRVAGEICERNNEEKITIDHIDISERKIEKDKVVDIVRSQPKQSQAALFSILSVTDTGDMFFTGDIYEAYKQVCQKSSLRPLTMRRISDIIAEMDTLGIINTQVLSKGRYGRTRKISLSVPEELFPKLREMLAESLGM
ncbi:MAG: Cdc6/Cdc18 family protein [Candidatus Woesearchaeota archaeon]